MTVVRLLGGDYPEVHTLPESGRAFPPSAPGLPVTAPIPPGRSSDRGRRVVAALLLFTGLAGFLMCGPFSVELILESAAGALRGEFHEFTLPSLLVLLLIVVGLYGVGRVGRGGR